MNSKWNVTKRLKALQAENVELKRGIEVLEKSAPSLRETIGDYNVVIRQHKATARSTGCASS